MPFVKPPGIIPYIDKSILNEFSYKAINCKPEAPWIKRCQGGIKFTEEIRSTIDSVEVTSKADEENLLKPVLVNEEQFIKLKNDYENVKLKAKSENTMPPSLSFYLPGQDKI